MYGNIGGEARLDFTVTIAAALLAPRADYHHHELKAGVDTGLPRQVS